VAPPARLERVLGQYDMVHATVTAAAFAPDGRSAISVGRFGDLVVWDLVSRAERIKLAPCRPGAGETTGLAISIDGRAAALADSDGWVCVRSLSDGRVARSWRAHDAPIRMLAVTPRGELVTYGYQPAEHSEAKTRVILKKEERDGNVKWWRFDGEGMNRAFALGPAHAVEVAPDGSRVVALGTDNRLRAWDGAGTVLWAAEKPSPGTFAFVSGGRLLIVEATRVHLVDGATGSDIAEVARTTPISKPLLGWMPPQVWSDCLVVTPDGRHAVTSLTRDSHVFIWDIEGRRESAHLMARDLGACEAGAATFSRDGTVVMTAGSDHLRLWDFARATPLTAGMVRSVAPSADGARIVTYGDDQLVKIWNLEGGAELIRWSARDVKSVAFADDPRRIVEISADGRSRMIDAATGAVVRVGSTAEARAAAASAPAPALITVNQDGAGALIRVHRRIQADTPEIQGADTRGKISATAVTPDGARLIVGTVRGLVLVFRL
jgi:WD40 repeat protein